MAAAKTKTSERDAAVTRVEQIEIRMTVRDAEISAIADEQYRTAAAGDPPNREASNLKVALNDEQEVDGRLPAEARQVLAGIQADIRRDKERASLERVNRELAVARATADQLRDAYPVLLLAELEETKVRAAKVFAAKEAIRAADRAELALAQAAATSAQRLGEPAPNIVVQDRIDQLAREHYTVDDVPIARVFNATTTQEVAREVAVACFTNRPSASSRTPTGADLFAEASRRQAAAEAERRRASGLPTPLEQQLAEQYEAERQARADAIAKWGTQA